MTPHDDTYTQLLAINRQAFDEADYETAYHALAAALHRAHWIHALALLAAVQDRAAAQSRHLAAHPPVQPPTVRRTLHSLYTALAAISAGHATLLASRHPTDQSTDT